MSSILSAWGRPTSAARVPGWEAGKYAFGSEKETGCYQRLSLDLLSKSCLSLSGSNQAREGRLVNALAARGDERRDTLR